MRVLQIGDDWPTERAGGLNSYFSNLLPNLLLLGVEGDGIVAGTGEVKIDSGGTVSAFARSDDPMLKRMICARRAAKEIFKRSPIDLIAVHFALYALPIPDLIRETPTVMHFHGPWAAESGVEDANNSSPAAWCKGALERSVYSAAKRLIVLSDAFKKELTQTYRVAEDRVRIVPGGVDTIRYNTDLSRSEARERLGWAANRKTLVTIRRQVRRMGLENLIEAAQILDSQHQDFMLYMGGSGPMSQELQQRILERGLDAKVKMLGRVSDSDLPLVYRAADLSVVPSQSLEGFGLIAIESLAAGTPVFVTPVGGLPEIVRPFAPQCVLENTSAQAIADGLLKALQSEHTLPSEQACRSYAVDNFSWSKIASQVRSVYEEALA